MQSTQIQAASAASTLAMLQSLYPGAVLLDTNQVAAAVGLSAKTIRNLQGKFPIPSLKLGENRRFRLVDVAAAIDAGITPEPQPQALASQPKRSRGRPRKVAGDPV